MKKIGFLKICVYFFVFIAKFSAKINFLDNIAVEFCGVLLQTQHVVYRKTAFCRNVHHILSTYFAKYRYAASNDGNLISTNCSDAPTEIRTRTLDIF